MSVFLSRQLFNRDKCLFSQTKKIGSLAPAYAFASQFSKSKNLSKTAISKSRSKRSQNQDLKFITHQASVLHTTHNTQVICLSHTQENTRSKIIDSHHKDSQTKKINNRARVRRRPCPRRPTAAGVPAPLRLATRCGGGSAGPSPRRSGRLLLVGSAPVRAVPASLHPSALSPPACSGGSSPSCMRGGLRPRGGWPARARARAAARRSLPAPGRGASKRESGRGGKVHWEEMPREEERDKRWRERGGENK